MVPNVVKDIRLAMMKQWEFFEQVTPRKALIQNGFL